MHTDFVVVLAIPLRALVLAEISEGQKKDAAMLHFRKQTRMCDEPVMKAPEHQYPVTFRGGPCSVASMTDTCGNDLWDIECWRGWQEGLLHLATRG
jgi:hypothetical protein